MALIPQSEELQLEMGNYQRQKPLIQNNNFKLTLGKQETANGFERQEVHGDKSGGENKKPTKQTKEERNRNQIPKANFFTCS